MLASHIPHRIHAGKNVVGGIFTHLVQPIFCVVHLGQRCLEFSALALPGVINGVAQLPELYLL